MKLIPVCDSFRIFTNVVFCLPTFTGLPKRDGEYISSTSRLTFSVYLSFKSITELFYKDVIAIIIVTILTTTYYYFLMYFSIKNSYLLRKSVSFTQPQRWEVKKYKYLVDFSGTVCNMCVIIRTPVIKRRKYKYFRNMSITIIIY